ncbi:MAG: hypothetical protein AAF598_16845 [Bacteroidota bacterium]
MKSLIQLIVVLVLLFALYLYVIREEIQPQQVIEQLETRIGMIDILERKIHVQRDSLDQYIARNSNNQNNLDRLQQTLEKTQQELQYNQKIARLQSKKQSLREQAEFDSLHIQPFKRKIAALEQEIMELTPEDLHAKTRQVRQLLNTFYEERDRINENFIRASLVFYPPEGLNGSVVIENQTDRYGRFVSAKSQVQTISNKLFGGEPPSSDEIQTFQELHRFWCSLNYDHPEGYCEFPWLGSNE